MVYWTNLKYMYYAGFEGESFGGDKEFIDLFRIVDLSLFFSMICWRIFLTVYSY